MEEFEKPVSSVSADELGASVGHHGVVKSRDLKTPTENIAGPARFGAWRERSATPLWIPQTRHI
jgi:hypothetical protein